MSVSTAIGIPLDEYAEECFRSYVDSAYDMEEARQRKDKARDALIAFFASNEAEIGTIEGKPVVRVIRSDREVCDVGRLKREEPFTYRRFVKVSPVAFIRLVDGRRSS